MDVRTTPETLPDTVNDIPVRKASTTARTRDTLQVFRGVERGFCRTDGPRSLLSLSKTSLSVFPAAATAAAGDFKSVELSGVRRIRAGARGEGRLHRAELRHSVSD